MTGRLDLIIRRARLRGAPGRLVDIGIAGGRIAAIEGRLEHDGGAEVDAGGGLVTESFVNPHLHLCKAWTRPLIDEAAGRDYQGAGMGRAMSAIERAATVKARYEQSWVAGHARRAVALGALHGNLHVRAFADVDSKARLEAVKALLQVREEFRGVVDIQVVAFAQDGIVREEGAAGLLREAMDLGADVVGGIPWIEYTDEEAAEHIRVCFDLARRSDTDVSMLLDDAGDPGLRTLEMMAVETLRRGWEGRALAHHCRAMALYPLPYFHRLAGTLRRARVSVVSDPHTGPLHARVRELREEGLNVCLGQDDIADAYYPFGRSSMLEVAFLAAHLLWMMDRSDLEALYDMITVDAARAINLDGYGLRPGAVADLVVLNAPDVTEALRHHERPARVVARGRLLDEAAMSRLAAPAEGPL